MGRVFGLGYELNQVAANSEVDGTPGGGGVNSSVVRSGTYAGRHNPTASVKFFQHQIFASDTDATYWRFYLRIASAPLAAVTIWRAQNTGSTTQASLRLNTDNTLQAEGQGGSDIGSASAALSTDTWYRIEIYINNSSAGNGTSEWRIDGVAFATQTDTTPDIDGTAKFDLGIVESTTADIYIDDFVVNDTTGSFQNSWAGAGELIHLRPNAAGDTDAWDLTTTYEDIDEVSPNDATDLISSLTDGDIHEVNVNATPAAMDTTDTITCVQLGVRFNESVGTDPDPTFVLRIKASASGTVEESATITADSTTWFTHITTVPRVHALTLYDLPGASTTPWTKADLDTAQIGVKLTNTPVGLAQVTAIWLLVDHKPSSGVSVTVDVDPQTITSSQPAASVSTTQNPTISPSAQTVTSSQPTIGIAIGDGASPTSQDLTISSPDPTITVIQNVSVSANVQTITASQETIGVSVGDGASVASQDLTLSQPAITVTTSGNVSINADVQTVTSSQASPSVGISESINVSSQDLTLVQNNPVVTAVRNVSISVEVLTVTTDSPSPSISVAGNVTTNPNSQTITSSQPESTITTVRNITVNTSVLDLTLSQAAATVTNAQNISISADVQTFFALVISPGLNAQLASGITFGIAPVERRGLVDEEHKGLWRPKNFTDLWE